MVGSLPKDSKVTNWAKETISPEQLQQDFDAVLLTGGSEQSRDLPVPGRDLDGIHFAMEFLPQQNKVNAGDKLKGQLRADGKHVIVIGGGDTGSDCVGTSNRHGAVSVSQFEVMPQPPEEENKPLVCPTGRSSCAPAPVTKRAAPASSPCPPRLSKAKRARSQASPPCMSR
jgi:glutamate synthase (NADPH/NADH) small chain